MSTICEFRIVQGFLCLQRRSAVVVVALALLLSVEPGMASEDEVTDEVAGSAAEVLVWRQQTPQRLRRIASRSDSVPVAALYFNRAYQLELERDYSFLGGMEIRGDVSGTNDLVAHRLLVVLTELLAEQTIADPEQRARVLNRFYDTALEAAELRFRGYDTAADLLGFE